MMFKFGGMLAENTRENVKMVQDVLNQKGYDCGKPDGVMGKNTKKAIIKKYRFL
ncbi:MAG: peptidoglycan-binding domain-containing protein [Lachnospiraceae bacterium]|nr:peptidoglycan-binding domain-containing protein [Lachnospiraceae bacterium]